jgi:hypothetical protein
MWPVPINFRVICFGIVSKKVVPRPWQRICRFDTRRVSCLLNASDGVPSRHSTTRNASAPVKSHPGPPATFGSAAAANLRPILCCRHVKSCPAALTS